MRHEWVFCMFTSNQNYHLNCVVFFLSGNIAPIALPSGSELNEDFASQSAIASGFGITADGIYLMFINTITYNIFV